MIVEIFKNAYRARGPHLVRTTFSMVFLDAIISNKTHLETHVPGQQKRTMMERAFDEHRKMKDHMWILKG